MRLSPGFLIYSFLLAFGFHSLHAQIPAQIDFKGQPSDSAAIISIRWSASEEKAWHHENDGKLDILGVKTNIRSEDLKKAISGTTTYTFEFEGSAVVEVMISLDNIAPGEALFLFDTKVGEVLFDIAKQDRKTLLTPEFDPSTTVLVWQCDGAQWYKSEFSISNIYVQPVIAGRAFDIGFGTAFPCHPNAACKQDSILQLIAASAVRIRLVMEEGIGWCSGSFVNNTRNDKTPYLLTAFHCQYNFTPHFDMWRFDFQYTSPACSNPATEPPYFSLTGCELISLGQASDFLLVKLNHQIPVNQDVTFAGWDRDETTTPDTSYLMHHPNADIRKISTSVNKAAIHPNQIGWTEGYTTPANHHFRLKFTEGGHEPGSSGGPLFNEAGLLVGQLHGGTAGCETTNNAYVGRLAKSWNPGSTPQERLSDWLDPDQTGLIQIPALENKTPEEITDIRGLITDPEGTPLKNVVLKITGSLEETLVTNDDGTFELSDVSRNGAYLITPEKKENPTNGVNALDLVAIQKHLLAKDTFDFPWQYIAADATFNLLVSVGDIVLLQKLLLGKIQTIPSSPSWRFDPPSVFFDKLPQGEPSEVQIMGIKIGDVNGTADPKL